MITDAIDPLQDSIMSLAYGRDHLAIPGPSVIPERVLRAMHRPAPNIYAGDLVDITETIFQDLGSLARCSGDTVIYIGNGHAAWEASLSNTLSRGDKLLGLATGRFGLGWAQAAEAMGAEVQMLDFGAGKPVDPGQVEAALRADTEHRIKVVTTVQTDTGTSVTNDIPAIRAAIDAAQHPALFMVDCIASFACEPFDMDAWGVDVMLAASQKGLMTPPGLAFLFINDKAHEVSQSANLKTPYWDWHSRITASVFPMKFGGTPPTHHLFGLREALNILQEEGIENTWQRHRSLASCVWAAVDAWASGSHISFNVSDPAHRSPAVTTIKTADGEASALREWCETEAGLTLGVGLDLVPADGGTHNLFRIGHMGHLNPPMLLGTLATTDVGLKALGIAHGSGALESACRVLANLPAATDLQ